VPWTEHEQAANEAAYDRMKAELDAKYPVGQFVAFGHGQVIGDSADFFALTRMIRAQGRDPREVMVVKIGEEDPTDGGIYFPFIRATA
jgi:hypothetical protein